MTFRTVIFACLAAGSAVGANAASHSFTTDEVSLYDIVDNGFRQYIGKSGSASATLASDFANPQNASVAFDDAGGWNMTVTYDASISDSQYSTPFFGHLDGFTNDVHISNHAILSASVQPDGSGRVRVQYLDYYFGRNADLSKYGVYYQHAYGGAINVPAGAMSALYGQTWSGQSAALVEQIAFSRASFIYDEAWETGINASVPFVTDGGSLYGVFYLGPAVPETSTWALMLSGLAVLGATARRRCRAQHPVTG